MFCNFLYTVFTQFNVTHESNSTENVTKINKTSTWFISSKKSELCVFFFFFRWYDTNLIRVVCKCLDVAVTAVVLNTTSCLFQSSYINARFIPQIFIHSIANIHNVHTWLCVCSVSSIVIGFVLVTKQEKKRVPKCINTLNSSTLDTIFFLRFYIIINMDFFILKLSKNILVLYFSIALLKFIATEYDSLRRYDTRIFVHTKY